MRNTNINMILCTIKLGGRIFAKHLWKMNISCILLEKSSKLILKNTSIDMSTQFNKMILSTFDFCLSKYHKKESRYH